MNKEAEIEKYKNLINCSKNIIKTIQKLDKIANTTRNSVDAEYECIYKTITEHEIHCLAVELGLASREDHRYGEKRRYYGSTENLIFYREPIIKF